MSFMPCASWDTDCDACERGKQCKPAYQTSTGEPKRVLQCIHADTVGALPSTCTGGECSS